LPALDAPGLLTEIAGNARAIDAPPSRALPQTSGTPRA
jgi:hypothetical protein